MVVMNMYAEQFFFSPNIDFERFVPVLVIIGILIIISLVVAFAYYYQQWEIRNAKDMHRFRSHAADYGLEKMDIILLLRWARWAKVRHFARLLTNVEAFEQVIRKIESKNASIHRKIRFSEKDASRIRMQLFGKDISPDQKIETSYELRPGLRLFLRYVDYADTALWGHLIDIEDEGLIVVIPNAKEVKIPLRPDTSLEITAFIPNHDPVTFNTAVKQVIPGPRKMVMLEHSTFMLPKRHVGPSYPVHFPPLAAGAAT